MFTKAEFRDLRIAVSLRAAACEENILQLRDDTRGLQDARKGAKRWRDLLAKIQRAEDDQTRKMRQLRAKAKPALGGGK